MTSKTEISESSSQRKIDFKKIEEKWQKRWEESGLFHAPDKPDGEKFYLLVMFAYPSGDIHMGHFRNYIIGDAVARWQMMKGKQVVHPFGWDAFGLPAERAAIKRNLNPADWTKENIKVSRDTLKKVGISFDWSREIVTSEPDYYRWSQWIFLRMFEKGLAYRKKGLVNWCPGCNTVLANEQVNQGICERCDSKIEKRDLEQWYFKITEYADRLIDDLDKLSNWPENVKTMQREWIGRSWGGDIDFKVEDSDHKICNFKITVFTTRPDTIFGATYMAIAPESDLVAKLPMSAENAEKVRSYRERALRKTEIERGAETGEKDGVFTGVYALNPFNGEKIQIWVADYVLAGYGSGAIMGVPGHDIRDHAFASKYDIPIIQVVQPAGKGQSEIDVQKEAYPGHGLSINSGEFDGLSSADAIEAICEYAEQKGFGKKSKHFKLRDWLISRQRYWGTPIPIIHCDKCGLVKVPDEQLPVILPNISDFLPKGRSPLEDVADFVNVDCPECGGKARRDVDTMDTFICSSWYLFRYLDPHNDKALFDSDKVNAWMPVDKYIGGITHATGHLLYFRYFTKFFYDMGLVNFDEPALDLFNHGMVSDSSGVVMSKSRGNVVSPIELMDKRGVDVIRLAMLFTAPSGKEVLWSDAAVTGVEKFALNKLAPLCDYSMGDYLTVGDKPVEDKMRPSDLKCHFKHSELIQDEWEMYVAFNQKLKRVEEDYNNLQFNTVISFAMELFRDLEKANTSNAKLSDHITRSIVQFMAPLAPHICEEIWSNWFSESVFLSSWPIADRDALSGSRMTIAVQVNGRLRGQVEVDSGETEDTIVLLARENEKVSPYLESKTVVKQIYVPGRLVNLVVK